MKTKYWKWARYTSPSLYKQHEEAVVLLYQKLLRRRQNLKSSCDTSWLASFGNIEKVSEYWTK